MLLTLLSFCHMFFFILEKMGPFKLIRFHSYHQRKQVPVQVWPVPLLALVATFVFGQNNVTISSLFYLLSLPPCAAGLIAQPKLRLALANLPQRLAGSGLLLFSCVLHRLWIPLQSLHGRCQSVSIAVTHHRCWFKFEIFPRWGKLVGFRVKISIHIFNNRKEK